MSRTASSGAAPLPRRMKLVARNLRLPLDWPAEGAGNSRVASCYNKPTSKREYSPGTGKW